MPHYPYQVLYLLEKKNAEKKNAEPNPLNGIFPLEKKNAEKKRGASRAKREIFFSFTVENKANFTFLCAEIKNAEPNLLNDIFPLEKKNAEKKTRSRNRHSRVFFFSSR